ncbi:unnamed protein product [Ectocarpus sp. 4 AP-2014]
MFVDRFRRFWSTLCCFVTAAGAAGCHWEGFVTEMVFQCPRCRLCSMCRTSVVSSVITSPESFKPNRAPQHVLRDCNVCLRFSPTGVEFAPFSLDGRFPSPPLLKLRRSPRRTFFL